MIQSGGKLVSMLFLAVAGMLARSALGEEPLSPEGVRFDFNGEGRQYGAITGVGTPLVRAEVKSKKAGSVEHCFAITDGRTGFRVGTEDQNCMMSLANPEFDKIFSGGFRVRLGYTAPVGMAELRPKDHVLSLLSKYDNGINARGFTVRASSVGDLGFEVSADGAQTLGCSMGRAFDPGVRTVIEAGFRPGKEIYIKVEDGRENRKTVSFGAIFQSSVPLCVGARLFNGNPINLGEGVIDFVEIIPMPVADATVTAPSGAPDVQGPEGTLLVLPESLAGATCRDNGLRGEICLNGVWRWQPQLETNQDAPDEDTWMRRKLPATRTDNFMVTDESGAPATQCQGKAIKGTERGWYGTEIDVPKAWEDREVFVEVQAIDGEEPEIVIGNKKMKISPSIPYKFPVTSDGNAIKMRIKANAVLQDVWLRSYPRQASTRFAGVSPSWRKKNLETQVEGVCSSEEKIFARTVITESPDAAVPVVVGDWQEMDPVEGAFVSKYTTTWRDPKAWTPDTPNLYFFSVEIRDRENRLLDRTLPLRFGFREIWVESGALKLNGTTVNLRGNNHTPFSSADGYSSYIANRENIEWILRKWKDETHLNSFLIWSGAEKGLADRSMVLEVADELGLLVVYQLAKGQMDFSDNAQVDHWNRRLLEGEVKRYAHHPSVFAWNLGSSHYTLICAPSMLGERFEPEMAFSSIRRQTEYFLPLKEMILAIDPSRVFTTHSGGHNRVADLLTGMVYINPDAGLQERANWPLAWWRNRRHLKPLFLTEISCPFWAVFYQRAAANSFPAPDSEPLFLEHGAELFGDRVYQDEPLDLLEKYFGAGQAVNLYWQEKPSPIVWAFKKEYLKYAYRAWRTYGVGFFLHVEIRPAFDRRRFPPPTRADDPRSPGLHPDRPVQSNDSTGDLNDWGLALQRHFDPFYAYIGGDGLFTSQDHAYYAGEPVVKRAILLNDFFRDLPVTVAWTLIAPGGETVLTDEDSGMVPAGERAIDEFRLQFNAPMVDERTEYVLKLKVVSGGEIREDQMAIQVFPRDYLRCAENSDTVVHVFDPVGETRAMLRGAGYSVKDVSDELPGQGVLVIGRHVLETPANLQALAEMGFDQKLEAGLRVVVFEQACGNILGLRANENSPRRTFVSAPGHAALSGLNDVDLWHWRGEGDLIESWPRIWDVGDAPGGWFPERFWKWGNDNNVATCVIQKPMQGAFRSLVSSGFDLMDSALLESCKGRGRILFCQLDVTRRYGVDPAASRLVRNLFTYMKDAPEPDSTLTEVAHELGEAQFEGCRARKPDDGIGMGLDNGDFYFREKVKLSAFPGPSGPELVAMRDGRAVISFKEDDLSTNWQKYKCLKILAALRMNQGGSSERGVSTGLQQRQDGFELYPLNWHIGYVHPYTGWCW